MNRIVVEELRVVTTEVTRLVTRSRLSKYDVQVVNVSESLVVGEVVLRLPT